MRRTAVLLLPLSMGCSGGGVTLTGTVVDGVFGGGLAANVCISDNCVETSNDGSWTLDNVPRGSRTLMTVTSETSQPALIGVVTRDRDKEVPEIPMLSTLAHDAQYNLLGLDPRPGTGVINFQVRGSIPGGADIAGVTGFLEPNAGDGPFYTTNLGLPGEDDDATTESGGGVWLNVPVGNYNLDFDDLPDSCRTELGWGGPENFDMLVQASFTTLIRVICEF